MAGRANSRYKTAGYQFLITLFAAVLMASCSSAVLDEPEWREVPADDRMKIVGYVFGTDELDTDMIDPDKLTHINYAFANLVDSEAVLQRPPDTENLRKLTALRNVNPDLKILVSVGGWIWSGGFSDAALTPESRLQFAESVVDMVLEHDLDGIDLDWEYPGQRGAGNVYREEDRENFTLMLRAVRKALDELSEERGREGLDRYQVTIATGASQSYFDNTEMDKAQRYLDFINIMAYDFHGEWTSTTGHHTNLYPNESQPQRNSAVVSVQRHLDAGIPVEKLVLGVAFYGRGWAGVNPENNGLFQPWGESLSGFGYAVLREEYIGREGFERHWDEEAMAPYLWNEQERIFITYDDKESLARKADYIHENGLTGIMYWQHIHDPDQRLLRLLNEELFSAGHE